MIRYFTHELSNDGKYSLIVPNRNIEFPMNTKLGGSYALAPARCLGLSYAQYLIFLRTMFPDMVDVRGKNSAYPVVYWKKGKEMYSFIELLNGKMSLAVQEHRMLEKEREENNYGII